MPNSMILALTLIVSGFATGESALQPSAVLQRGCGAEGPLITILEGSRQHGQGALLLLARPGAAQHSIALGRPSLPDDLLLDEDGSFVLAWSDAEPCEVRWFDAAGVELGRHEPIEPGAAPLGPAHIDRRCALAVRAGGRELVVPLTSGSRYVLDLETGEVAPLEEQMLARLRDAARDLSRAGRHAEATEALDAALQANPGDADAWRALAQALERQGSNERAHALLGEAVATLCDGRTRAVSSDWSVTDPRARLTLTLLQECEARGDARGADRALEALVRLYPCMEQATLHRAQLARAAAADPACGHAAADGVLNETIDNLEDPRARAAAHLDAARFHEDGGALDLAVQHLGKAVTLGEEREIVLRSLARIEAQRGYPLVAATWLERLRARWERDHRLIEDDRRRQSSGERLARLESEIESLRGHIAR